MLKPSVPLNPPLGAGEGPRLAPLRRKMLLVLAPMLLIALAALYIPLRVIVLGSYLALEAQTTHTEVERANNALTVVLMALNTSAASYAIWDNTYTFVQNHDERYITVDLADPAFTAEKINVLLIADTDRKIVYSKGFDLTQQREVALPALLLQPAFTHSALFQNDSLQSSKTGIVMLPEGPLLVAARPILTSDEHGPSRGTLLMGRWLDAALISSLAKTTHLTLGFYHTNDPQLPSEVRGARAPTMITTLALSADTVAGYLLLPDVAEQPGLTLEVKTPRTVYQQGFATVNYVALVLVAITVICFMLALIGLERVVLARLARLDARAHTIGDSGDLSLRMDERGDDELARLARSINTMLAALDRAQASRRQAEAKRAQTQEELLRAREQLSQMIVHDLKNPLTAVLGHLDLLQLFNPDAEQAEVIASARRSSVNMLALVTQILDIARLTEGRLTLRRDTIEVAGLIQACAYELQPWASLEFKSLVVRLPPNLPLLRVDSGLLQRVLINVISNAIKHTPPNIMITVTAEDADGGLAIHVHDTGPGLPADLQARLFERFSAADMDSEGLNSTGLGLAFCKLAVEAHDGTITVQSAAGAGTMFTVWLPASALAPTAETLRPTEAPRDLIELAV